MIADRMIPPWARRAPAPSRAPALIRRDGGFGICLTGQPPGLPLLDVRCDGCGFLRLRGGIGLRLLLRQLARMHHDQAQCLLGDAPLTVLDLDVAEHALPRPVARRLVLGPPGLLHEEGQGGLLAPPGFKVLPDGTGTRDARSEADPVLQTQP